MPSRGVLPLIEVGAVHELWPNIVHLLERIADEKLTVSDIYDLIIDGTWTLWVPDTGEITTVIVTEFIRYPQVCNLRVVILSGGGEDWPYGMRVFEDFARINKCHAIEILGRKGWERVLKDNGFKLNHITLSKRIL